ncbi:MAG TPA: ParB N-terminal domain-containing protein [Candidatus Angelobacter sp.]|nr:ParB N-terminal domain-containing protein [Candidatus Angelobacter sp.]
MPAAKKLPSKTPAKKPTKRSARSGKPASARGPEPRESLIDAREGDLADLSAQVEKQGGAVVGAYRDPFAGQALVLASLPIKKVVATPFQRDLSRTHATRLVDAIGAAGLFLDPVIAVPSKDGFWSPNGRHRLEAARRLGMRSVTALLVPDDKLAFRILALNTEKAHNLRDRSLEVIRMARQLAKEQPRSKENEHAVTFESPAFLTLGVAYEQRSRFSGSSYQSVLNKVDRFLDSSLPAALRQREQWAVRIMDIDDRVAAHVKTMQAMGMKSPYLRAVVVARINPVRFVPPSRKKDAPPPMSMAEALTKMAANVRKFDPRSVKPGDLALVAAIAPSSGES